MQNPILEAALEYARLGYRVIPLKPGTKVPDLRHWPEEATNHAATVAAHFTSSASRARGQGYPNVGIVTGNGLAVLDIDSSHGGERPEWAVDTLTVRTASGGLHLYYAVDRPVPNSVGRLGLGVDVRGERGQVAAPPSVVRYDRYRVTTELATVAPEDRPFVVDTGNVTDQGARPIIYHVHEHGLYAIEDDRPIALIDANLLIPLDQQQDYLGRSARKFVYRDEVPVGQRNNYLTSLAGYLFSTGNDYADVRALVGEESMMLDFAPRQGELDAIVSSVARYHQEQER